MYVKRSLESSIRGFLGTGCFSCLVAILDRVGMGR